MDKIHDNQQKEYGRSASDIKSEGQSMDRIETIAPPVFQLKADAKSNEEEGKEESAVSGKGYQLAAEGVDPPSDPSVPNDDSSAQTKPNNTGLPTQLKSGFESLSGFSLDDVKVHYNSDKPAQLQAHAYAQGTDIHVASGQEKHLPHEAWHVVQQKQGRVQPTAQLKAFNINDDAGLEKEADVMGAKANRKQNKSSVKQMKIGNQTSSNEVVQRIDDKNKGKLKGLQNINIADMKAPNKTSTEIVSDLTDKSGKIKGPISAEELAYLLEEAVKSAFKTYAFHATKKRNLPSILANGLDPNYGGTGAASESEEFKEKSKNKVHYARNVGTAASYKDYFEDKGTPFPGKKDEDPAPAEIMRIALHSDIVNSEEVDPDSPKTDKAFTTSSMIDKDALNPIDPKALPNHSGELTPGENTSAFIDYMNKSNFESEALLSNMPAETRDLIDSIIESSDGMTKETLLQMIKQGIKSMKTSDVISITEVLKLGFVGRHGVNPLGLTL